MPTLAARCPGLPRARSFTHPPASWNFAERYIDAIMRTPSSTPRWSLGVYVPRRDVAADLR